MTPTLAMRSFNEMNQRNVKQRRRSEAAKKAWRTRRRMAKPTPMMRRWLEWLSKRPENVVSARYETEWGTSFTFAAFPGDTPPAYCGLRFTRGTFFALQKRGWVKQIARTEPHYAGGSFGPNGMERPRHAYYVYWGITEKGRKAIGRQG